jgi:tetratricopeptide (TPR) repeat protein
LRDEPEVQSPEDFVAARERQAAEAAKERARAEKLWQRLQASGDPKAWRTLVLEDPAFQSWALCETLCHESAAVADDDAGRAGELVDLALELAPRIDLPKNRRAGLFEYVWKHVGNVYGARGDLQRADDAFARAQEYSLEGMMGVLPGVLDRARLSALESALHRNRGDLAGAVDKIGFALRLAGDHEPSRSAFHLEEGRLRRRLGQPERALEALTRARQSAGTSDARLLLRIHVELGSVLCDLGRPGEVRKLPAVLHRTAEGFPTEKARLHCLDGRVAAGLGRLPEAKAALQQLSAELPDRAASEVARLLLDVAVLCSREGRAAELKSLAELALRLAGSPVFSREAAATLKLFSRLATQEKLTPERAAQFAKDWIACP